MEKVKLQKRQMVAHKNSASGCCKLSHHIYIENPSAKKINVVCEVEGLNSDEFIFCIGFSEKHNTMFKDLLAKRDVSIKLMKEDGKQINIRENSKREYSCATGGSRKLTFHYSLCWKNAECDIGRYHCVSNISEKNFIFHPFDILLQPTKKMKVKHIVTFEKLPSGWSIAGGNSAKIDDKNFEISDPREVLFFLGNLSCHHFKIGKSLLDIYLDKTLDFPIDVLLKNTKLIAQWQENIFGNIVKSRQILIGAYPEKLKGKMYAFSGTVKNDTVMQYCGAGPDSGPVSLKALLYTLHHEMFHLYNPYSLKDGSHIDNDNANKYWFTEGFTEYMAQKGALATKMITEEDFLSDMGAKYLSCLKADRFTTCPLFQPGLTATECWSDVNNYWMLYCKGALIAWLMDLELEFGKNVKGGLPPLLNHIFTKYRRNGKKLLTEKLLVKEFRTYSSGILRSITDDYITGIKFLDLPSLLRQKGFDVAMKITTKG